MSPPKQLLTQLISIETPAATTTLLQHFKIMMQSNNQIIKHKLCAVLMVSTLTVGVIFCAPQQKPQQTSSSSGSQISAHTATKSSASSASAPKSSSSSTSGSQLSSAASITSGSPSLVDFLTPSISGPNNNHDLDTFDGKNPFSDESLWQIPVHLVRDLSSVSDSGAAAASETSDANEDQADSATGPPQSSSSSPAVISASTDLKTAAGYHYPSHGHYSQGHEPSYYGAHEQASYHGGHEYGGHHGLPHYSHGDDHYGKYFQYASVPYPYSWDFGYRRGNPYHTIERHEHGKGPHFQTKVKWSDKDGGYGVHVWDYNHDDHHSQHYGGHYDSHAPSHYGGHHGGHYGGHYGHH